MGSGHIMISTLSLPPALSHSPSFSPPSYLFLFENAFSGLTQHYSNCLACVDSCSFCLCRSRQLLKLFMLLYKMNQSTSKLNLSYFNQQKDYHVYVIIAINTLKDFYQYMAFIYILVSYLILQIHYLKSNCPIIISYKLINLNFDFILQLCFCLFHM